MVDKGGSIVRAKLDLELEQLKLEAKVDVNWR